MRILLASSELHPYSKTGGLADMVAALGKALAKAGHQVGIVTPLYQGIREALPGLKRVDFVLNLPLGSQQIAGEVWSQESESGTLYFIEQPGFFHRGGLYQQYGQDYPDNAERFIFFSKAIACLALHLPWRPQVVHLNDWQTTLAALLLHHQRKLPGGEKTPRTLTTIHNLAFQGLFPVAKYALLNLPWDYYSSEGVEFYGQLNCLKAGIAYSDMVTTVSPRYAREITTEAFGCGLDGLLRARQGVLRGILNGVDYDIWNSSTDPYLAHPFNATDLSGKAAQKALLQKEFGLPEDPGIPLFGCVGRMTEQKGVDILRPALEEMLSERLQFVMVGTGSKELERSFSELGRRFGSKASVRIGFDEALSHRLEAGCDFFLMPSRFEPCGLNQMYSLRYGTIPVVHAVGGLDDTVIDVKENAENANGIKFHDYNAGALSKAMHKALALFAETELLAHFRTNGMRRDFSWSQIGEEYVRAYQGR